MDIDGAGAYSLGSSEPLRTWARCWLGRSPLGEPVVWTDSWLLKASVVCLMCFTSGLPEINVDVPGRLGEEDCFDDWIVDVTFHQLFV